MACRGGVCSRRSRKRGAQVPVAQPAALTPELVSPATQQMGMAQPMVHAASIQQPHRSFGQKFKQFFTGKPESALMFERFTPEQQQALSSLLQSGLQGLGQTQPSFNPIEDYYMRLFQEQLVPSIAERFTSMGQGAQSSSAFPQILGQQAGGLASQLAALRANYNISQQGNLLNQIGMGLSPRFETAFRPGSRGLLGGLASGAGRALGGIGQGLGMALPFMI